MGSPNLFSYGFLGFPNSHPGSMGFPMPFSAFPRRSCFSFLRIFASHPFGYRVFSPLWHSKALFTDLTSVIHRGLPFVFFRVPFSEEITTHFLLRGIVQLFGLTRSIIDQDAQPSPGTGLLENSKDTQFTQRKKGISRRQKRNLFPPSPRCTRKLSNDATVDLLSNCDDTDGG